MGVDIQWANDDQTVILCTISGEGTWEDLYTMVEQQVVMMASVDHIVHNILNFEAEIKRIPPNAFLHLRRLMSIDRPNEGGVVIVGGPAMAKNLLSIVHRIYGLRDEAARMMFADTVEEAYTLLAAYEQRTRQNT